jgi:holin-like protein
MKYIKQLGIILLVSFIGEIFKYLIPLPVPASIYGLLVMLIALKTKIIHLDMINDVGSFLLEIMPIMFIPSAVGILASWQELEKILVPGIVATVAATIIVMVVSGRITQAALRRSSKNVIEINEPLRKAM